MKRRIHVDAEGRVSSVDLLQSSGFERLDEAATMLLLPDLIAFLLTGELGAEATNASTTALFDARRREWDLDLVARAGISASILPAVREPGSIIGTLTRQVAESTGLRPDTPVIAVGSHDTASAVVAVPFEPGVTGA